MVRIILAAVALASVALVPTSACPPAVLQQQSYCASGYQQTVTLQSYPLTFLAVPTIVQQVQQQVAPPPATREVQPPPMQEQQTVVPQAAPITVQVPQPAAIIQRQVIQSYYTPPQVLVNSVCGYGCDGGQSFGSQVIINRSGSSRSRGSERVIINDRSRVRSNQRINVQVREKQGLFRNRSSTKVFIRGR